MVEQLVKLPNTVSLARIEERIVERIADIPVLQVVEELVEVLLRKLVRLQRIQTRVCKMAAFEGAISQFIDKVVDFSVVAQRRIHMKRSVIGVNLTPLCVNNSYINFVLLSDSTILFTSKRQVIVDLHLVHRLLQRLHRIVDRCLVSTSSRSSHCIEKSCPFLKRIFSR